jgi:ABC-type transporter MlaC component
MHHELTPFDAVIPSCAERLSEEVLEPAEDGGAALLARWRHSLRRPAKDYVPLSAIAVMVLTTAVAFLPVPAFAQAISKGSEAAGRARPLELGKSSFAPVMEAEGGRRQAEIRRVTEQLFDFHEMSRRMLGGHWQEGSVPQQEEFVQLFTEMLERMYLTNIASLPLAAVKFEGELISGDYARVNSRIAGRRGDTSVEYRLVGHDGQWVVYDIAVEGVGLASSYRSQLNSILRNASFASLLERLRSREASARIEQRP